MAALSIRILDSADAHSLNDLRAKSYRQRYGANVDVEALRWNPNLTDVLDLGLFEGDQLVSAYRIDCVRESAAASFALQTQLEAHLQLNGLEYPIAIGCRACTLPDRQDLGFHFILRLAAIQILRELKVSFLASTFAGNNPWTSSLRSAGYEIFENKQGWSDFLRSDLTPSVAVLDLKVNGAKAVEALAKKTPPAVLIGDSTVESSRWGVECINRFPRARAWSRHFGHQTKFKFERLELNENIEKAIVELRQSEFVRKFGADVDLKGLNWNHTDSESKHFGASIDGVLVSTLRLTEVVKPEVFQGILLFDSNNPFVKLPCSILARAATNRAYAGLNLAMRLRILAYKDWLDGTVGDYIYGTAFANSTRLETLRTWGYEFVENTQPWSGYLKSRDQSVMAFRLERRKLQALLPKLELEFHSL